jgi:hypothetical protein
MYNTGTTLKKQKSCTFLSSKGYVNWMKPTDTHQSLNSSGQYFPVSVVPYIAFLNMTGLPQYAAYSGNNPQHMFDSLVSTLLLV